MTDKYDRQKFVEEARAAEAQRLAKQDEWHKKNEELIKKNGPFPFEVPKLIFDGK